MPATEASRQRAPQPAEERDHVPRPRGALRLARGGGGTRRTDLGRYRVLDVGCGIKPYLPYFEPYAAEYVGVDLENPAADLEGSVEALPVEDASLRPRALHAGARARDDPDVAVRELHRVAAPGGRVLASTHGVQVYHPSPTDYWRWTHTGLERLFARNGDWAR